MSDFSVHRIIGRGGFGEVFGCRKVDTGKMYAMKCLGMIHIYDSIYLTISNFPWIKVVRKAYNMPHIESFYKI